MKCGAAFADSSENPEKHPFNPQRFLSVSAGFLFVSISSFIKARTHPRTNRYRHTHTHTHSWFDWLRIAWRDPAVPIVAGHVPIMHCCSFQRVVQPIFLKLQLELVGFCLKMFLPGADFFGPFPVY